MKNGEHMKDIDKTKKIILLGKKLKALEQAKSMLYFNMENSVFKSNLEEKIRHQIIDVLLEIDTLLVKAVS